MNFLTDAELDDKIEEWHNGDGNGQELHEYLGWTETEYRRWFATGWKPGDPE